VAIAGAPATDQRGFQRVVGVVDIGAVEVQPDNRPPVANPDTASVTAGGTVTITPTANDHDPDGDTLTVVSVSGATKGVAAVVGDSVVYSAGKSAAGTDSLTYVVSDGTTTVTGTIVTVMVPARIPATGGDTTVLALTAAALLAAGSTLTRATRRRPTHG
jgi:hypothetical protein